MNIDRDAIRHQLDVSKQEHALALPTFREALKRAFDPRSGVSDHDKAALVGAPGRRTFLKVGGATFLGSAVLVGCGASTKPNLAVSGTSLPDPSSTTTTAPGSAAMDLELVRTAQSIEELALQAYARLIASGVLTTAAIVEALKLFQTQHQDHRDLLATTTTGLGGTPYGKANAYLDVTVVTPALAKATTEAAALKLAITLEDTLAATYVQSGGQLTTGTLRAAVMSIGATEARHLSILYGLESGNPVPLAFSSTHSAAPGASFIGPNGPVHAPPTPAPAGA